jgi:hypothetical protein
MNTDHTVPAAKMPKGISISPRTVYNFKGVESEKDAISGTFPRRAPQACSVPVISSIGRAGCLKPGGAGARPFGHLSSGNPRR